MVQNYSFNSKRLTSRKKQSPKSWKWSLKHEAYINTTFFRQNFLDTEIQYISTRIQVSKLKLDELFIWSYVKLHEFHKVTQVFMKYHEK